MGSGSYSHDSRNIRATAQGFHSKPIEEVLSSRLHADMNPMNVGIRESRDSDEHPNSLPIILGLDLTASMGFVPQELLRDGLPNIMGKLMEIGIADPQLLFLGIGDHKCDRGPLQVGQFESSDELIDKWLTSVWLEGGGGGNGGESYLLAWYFAARHTIIDSFEKRKQKGILITIGDEKTHKDIDLHSMKRITGNGDFQLTTAGELLSEASMRYEVYHIHVKATYNGKQRSIVDDWRELLGDNLIEAEDASEVSLLIPQLIGKHRGEKSEIVEDIKEISDTKKQDDDPASDNQIFL